MSTTQDKVQIRVEVDGQQGISELNKLETEAANLQADMKGLKKGTEEYAKSAEQLREVKNRMAEVREEVGLTGLTMRQLTKYQGELKAQMANTTAGTDRWKQLDAQLQEVTGTINKQRGTLTEFQKGWQSVKQELFSMGVQAAVVGVLLAIGAAMLSVIENSAKLADSLSNIVKTTGMTSQEVSNLNSQLSKISTRTAREELRSIAAVAGQLGIGKEDILGFVGATDKLNVALGDEIKGGAEEVTRVMGGLRNIFTDIKSDKVDEDMLHIGNALNVLGAEGAATAPVVADIANRIGGVGITMGLTSGQVLGLSATMQELNITAERGGTAVVKILQHMAAAPEKFATATKLSAAEFKHLVDTDIYAALKLVMEGAAGGGRAATELAATLDALGVDGAGSSEVIAKMGMNVAMLDTKTQSATKSLGDTKSILNEFNTLNDNFAGKLERVGKWWNGLFSAQAMQPMIEGMVTWLDKLVGAKTHVQELTEQWEKQADMVNNLHQNIEPLLDRYDDLSLKSALSTEEQTELKGIIEQVGEAVPIAALGFDAYGKAIDISTGKTRTFIKESEEMMKHLNKEAIKGKKAEIDDLYRDLMRYQNELEGGVKRGSGFGGAPAAGEVKARPNDDKSNQVLLTNDDVGALNTQITALQAEIRGAEAALAKMQGVMTNGEMEAEVAKNWGLVAQQAEKAAKEAATQLGLLARIEAEIKRLKSLQEGVGQHQGDDPAEIARLQKQIDAQEEAKQKLLGKWKDKEAAAKKKKADKDAEDARKEHERILAEFYKLQEQVHRAQEKVNLDRLSADERELQEIEQKYDELTDKAVDFANNMKLTAKERELALLEIQKINDAKQIELADKKVEQLKKREEIRLRNAKAEVEAEAALHVLEAQMEVERLENDHSNRGEDGNLEREKEKAKAKEALGAAQVNQVLKLRNLELFELDKLRKKDLLSEQDYAERRKLILKKAEKDIGDIHKKTSEEIFKENMARINKQFTQMQDVGNQIAGLLMQSQQNDQKREEQKYKKQLKDLDERLKRKLISEDQYNNQKASLEQHYEEDSARRQEKMAETQKAVNIFNATMNGITAATKALAELGPVAGPPAAALIGLFTAAQVAMLIAEPIPAFVEGGYSANGLSNLPHQNLSRSAGGELPGGPFLATVNEAGPEYFVPNRLLSDPRVRPHVQAIEAIRTTGGAGRSQTEAPGFAQGGPTSTATAGSGSFGAPSSSAAPMCEATGQQLVQELRGLRQDFAEGRIRAEVVPEELARTTDLLTAVRKDGSF